MKNALCAAFALAVCFLPSTPKAQLQQPDATSASVLTTVSSVAGTYGRLAAGIEADLLLVVALGLMGGITFGRSSQPK